MRKQSILIEWLYVDFRFAVLAFGLPLFSLFVSFRLIHLLIRLSTKAFSHSHSALNSTIHMYIVFVLDVIFVFYLPKMECTIHSACPSHENSMLNNNLCVSIYFVMFASFAVHIKPQKSFQPNARNTWLKPKIYVCQICRLRYAHRSTQHSLCAILVFSFFLSFSMLLSNLSRIKLPLLWPNISTLMLNAICFTFRCLASKQAGLVLGFGYQMPNEINLILSELFSLSCGRGRWCKQPS